MKSVIMAMLVLVGLPVCASSFAQTAPAVTATCKDGTTFSGPSRRGACSRHGGVQAYTTPAATPAPASSATSAAPPAAASAAPSATPVPASARPSPPARATTTSASAAAAAHPGQVWVNTASKVYHCAGDRYFGTTKAGEYMTEADAKTKGFRPSGGKTCNS